MAEAMSAEELEALGKTLAEMGLKPKADNPQAFKEWMEQYAESVHSLPKWETKSAASSYIPPVKISYFSGDSSAKGHVDFDVWLYEVECLMKSESVSPDAINQVVRHSLKGDAARVAMRLGPAANVYQLIDKLKSVFGVVASSETLMAQFYNSRQGECESVSAWSRRLDNIIGQALTQGEVHSSDIDRMLRSRFWHGLRRDLKDCSGHKFDTAHSFDHLVTELRSIEQDRHERNIQPLASKKPTPGKMAAVTSTESPDTLGEIKGMIQQMNARFEKQEARFCHLEKQLGQDSTSQGNQKGAESRFLQQKRFQPQASQAAEQQTRRQRDPRGIQCFRCRQYGHIAIGCRVRLDHSRFGLNGNRP